MGDGARRIGGSGSGGAGADGGQGVVALEGRPRGDAEEVGREIDPGAGLGLGRRPERGAERSEFGHIGDVRGDGPSVNVDERQRSRGLTTPNGPRSTMCV